MIEKNISYRTTHRENVSKNSNIIVIILSLIVLSFLGFLLKDRIISYFNKNNNEEEVITENPKEIENEQEPEIIEEKIGYFEYDFEPTVKDGIFFESLVQIDGQNCYISSPLKIEIENPPKIIIYSHGSTFIVDDNMDGRLMPTLRTYAEYFTNNNYIFAASNQHGDNWGSDLALEDTRALYDYIKENFKHSDEVYLIGYSMGGLPTMNYTMKYPNNIKKIALLAPTSYYSIYTQAKVDIFKDIPITIWHGNKDVNVPISMSYNLVNRFSTYGKEISLNTLEGHTHWDIDIESMEDINYFFNE